ncbi:MAG TPA: hypothetical protein VGV39_00275 [Mesorhizobium sp.]|jgi:hypothetical protein|uniref:hypothetical protein n=1 Tax=Mesorhizobium sp. TaxID=1871066 RepID=UPI002DDD4981|nr:hypothetical protein [Mesorhizobium sp.]HEV2501476.1 hypothetical protein [Mesorhizobium sp.]
MLERYRLASDALKVPMPDRDGRLFSVEGETVDTEHPFYAVLIADGDIVKEPAAGGQRKGKDNGPV